ncbi:Imidazolonepropionase [Arthrobotrys entomopaga]|nr:Imidazolonepropionase [Arthrobotrys entomopaga]
MAESLLLKNGTVLIHDEKDVVVPQKVDILVVGNKIEKIGESLEASDAEVLDCSNKIISPGFVDTHHHCWQTQLKGRHANHSLLEYLPTGGFVVYLFDPEDVYIGELGGLMELVDSGVTTVVDHCHGINSPEHADAAITATVRSGIRSILCYSTSFRTAEWTKEKYVPDPNVLPDWFLEHFKKLALQKHADGRVEIGFGWDMFFIGEDANKMVFKTVRDAGAKLITTHWCSSSPIFGNWSNITTMDKQGLAGSDVLVSHANQLSDEEAAILEKYGMSISSTPMTELQMGHGVPICYDPRVKGRASLGIDCHSSGAGDMVTQMRVGLQAARGIFNQKYVEEIKNPYTCKQTVEEAFNLATIDGARACNMGDIVGSIAVGKKADFVIFDTDTPAMVCGAQKNPLAAIVMHSSVRDIDIVIVDGVIRKKDGKLLPVKGDTGEDVTWKDIVAKLEESYNGIEEKAKAIDFDVALKAMQGIFHLDMNNFPKV